MTQHAIIPRDTLRDFLSRYAAPGADFPTGARLHAAGRAHGEADGDGSGGFDYTRSEVVHAIAEWDSVANANRYANAYQLGYAESAERRAAAREALERDMRAMETAEHDHAYACDNCEDHGTVDVVQFHDDDTETVVGTKPCPECAEPEQDRAHMRRISGNVGGDGTFIVNLP